MYVHSGIHFYRYFNEFEKINTHIYIVFQIDKNITILIILNTVIWLSLQIVTLTYYVRTAVIVYLTPNFLGYEPAGLTLHPPPPKWSRVGSFFSYGCLVPPKIFPKKKWIL